MTASTTTVSDVEGVTFTAAASEFIGSAERRNRDVPTHLHNLVRLTSRSGMTKEWLLTTSNARALAAALMEAADAVDETDRGLCAP